MKNKEAIISDSKSKKIHMISKEKLKSQLKNTLIESSNQNSQKNKTFNKKFWKRKRGMS